MPPSAFRELCCPARNDASLVFSLFRAHILLILELVFSMFANWWKHTLKHSTPSYFWSHMVFKKSHNQVLNVSLKSVVTLEAAISLDNGTAPDLFNTGVVVLSRLTPPPPLPPSHRCAVVG